MNSKQIFPPDVLKFTKIIFITLIFVLFFEGGILAYYYLRTLNKASLSFPTSSSFSISTTATPTISPTKTKIEALINPVTFVADSKIEAINKTPEVKKAIESPIITVDGEAKIVGLIEKITTEKIRLLKNNKVYEFKIDKSGFAIYEYNFKKKLFYTKSWYEINPGKLVDLRLQYSAEDKEYLAKQAWVGNTPESSNP